jgi:hypothetical protein
MSFVKLNDEVKNNNIKNVDNNGRGRTFNKCDQFKRSKSESKVKNGMFCPYCNKDFQYEGRFSLHYETQLHKKNVDRCKKPFNIFKLEKNL